MIHLDIQEYCHGCQKFDPRVDNTYLYSNGIRFASDTKVYCANCVTCEIIVGHLKRKLAEEKKNDQD